MKANDTLAPTHRLDFGEALTPPQGYSLDAAIGTTFSAEFATALTVPVAMALRGGVERDELMENPLAALAAMQRLQDRVRIYVEAGNIHPPTGKGNALISLLEDTLVEVAPPSGASFHPKLWLLRFTPDSDREPYRQRLIIMSRNLTRDRSWDIALRLEGKETATDHRRNDPIAKLIDWLPGRKPQRVRMMRDRLPHVRWERVPDFSGPVFHSHFPGSGFQWKPGKGTMAVISPFCDDAGLNHLGRDRICALVACDDWLAGLNQNTLRCMTLSDHAVIEQEPTEHQERAGLHAKIFITEHEGETAITLGSGNATAAGLATNGMRNIEVFATLRGNSAKVGGIGLGDAGLMGHGGIGPLLVDWVPRTLTEEESENAAFEDAVRKARQAICAAKPRLTFKQEAESWSATLSMEAPSIPGIQRIHARLATLHSPERLAGPGPWKLGITSLLNATRFIRFDLKGDKGRTASFVTQAEAEGLPDGEIRLRAIFDEIVRSPDQIFSFVHAMLETTPNITHLMRTGRTRLEGEGKRRIDAPPFLEALLKTFLSDNGQTRIAELDKLLNLTSGQADSVKKLRDLLVQFRKAGGKPR